MHCGLTSHTVNTWNAAFVADLHTQLFALIASLRLKRVGLTYAGRDTCQRTRQGPADDTQAVAQKIEEALPWSKNRRQITGSGKRRGAKTRTKGENCRKPSDRRG